MQNLMSEMENWRYGMMKTAGTPAPVQKPVQPQYSTNQAKKQPATVGSGFAKAYGSKSNKALSAPPAVKDSGPGQLVNSWQVPKNVIMSPLENPEDFGLNPNGNYQISEGPGDRYIMDDQGSYFYTPAAQVRAEGANRQYAAREARAPEPAAPAPAPRMPVQQLNHPESWRAGNHWSMHPVHNPALLGLDPNGNYNSIAADNSDRLVFDERTHDLYHTPYEDLQRQQQLAAEGRPDPRVYPGTRIGTEPLDNPEDFGLDPNGQYYISTGPGPRYITDGNRNLWATDEKDVQEMARRRRENTKEPFYPASDVEAPTKGWASWWRKKFGSANNISQAVLVSQLMHNSDAMLGGMTKEALGTAATSAIGAGIGGLAGYLLGRKDDKLFSTLTGAGIGALGGYGVGKYMNPSAPAATTTTTITEKPKEEPAPKGPTYKSTEIIPDKITPLPETPHYAMVERKNPKIQQIVGRNGMDRADVELSNITVREAEDVKKIQNNPRYTAAEKKMYIEGVRANADAKRDEVQKQKDADTYRANGNYPIADFYDGRNAAERFWGGGSPFMDHLNDKIGETWSLIRYATGYQSAPTKVNPLGAWHAEHVQAPEYATEGVKANRDAYMPLWNSYYVTPEGVARRSEIDDTLAPKPVFSAGTLVPSNRLPADAQLRATSMNIFRAPDGSPLPEDRTWYTAQDNAGGRYITDNSGTVYYMSADELKNAAPLNNPSKEEIAARANQAISQLVSESAERENPYVIPFEELAMDGAARPGLGMRFTLDKGRGNRVSLLNNASASNKGLGLTDEGLSAAERILRNIENRGYPVDQNVAANVLNYLESQGVPLYEDQRSNWYVVTPEGASRMKELRADPSMSSYTAFDTLYGESRGLRKPDETGSGPYVRHLASFYHPDRLLSEDVIREMPGTYRKITSIIDKAAGTGGLALDSDEFATVANILINMRIEGYEPTVADAQRVMRIFSDPEDWDYFVRASENPRFQ